MALIVDEGPRFVSRGGIKLENALDALGVDVAGRDCLDVGASTGGFTDCLLQRGAARWSAVDVAYGQIDVGLREDPRVTVIERLNARELLPYRPALRARPGDGRRLLHLAGQGAARCGRVPGADGAILAMVKPQFELGRERVGRGVVRDRCRPARGDPRRGACRARAGPCRPRLRLVRPAGPEGQPRDLCLVRRQR